MNFLSNLLDLNKNTAKTAFLILLISSCLLFLPPDYLGKLEITGFKQEFGKYFGFAFLVSSAFLFVVLWNLVQQKINRAIKRGKVEKGTGRIYEMAYMAEIAVYL